MSVDNSAILSFSVDNSVYSITFPIRQSTVLINLYNYTTDLYVLKATDASWLCAQEWYMYILYTKMTWHKTEIIKCKCTSHPHYV